MESTLFTSRSAPSALLFALSIVICTAPAAARQCHDKIIPDAVERGDRFGGTVAADGDRAVVGAIGSPTFGPGAAYVLELGGSGWSLAAELHASDGGGDDRFASSVALDGDVATIGAPYHDGLSANCGAAYVFRRGGSGWAEEQRLFAPDAGFGDLMASDVALEGNLLVAGAPAEEELGDFAGAAYVFVFDGTSWQHRAKLLASDGAKGADFGRSVEISGGRIFVGAQGDSERGQFAGAVYVFEIVGGVLSETAKLTASDAAPDDLFGLALAVDGDRALISAPHIHQGEVEFGPGAVYVFEFLGGNWVEVDRVQIAGIYDEAYFGASVALDGDLAVVGAPTDYDESLGFITGSTFFLRRSSAGWIAIDMLYPPEATGLDLFGRALALSGGTVLAGTPGDADQGNSAGALYAIELACICGTLGDSMCFGDGSGTACPCGNGSAAGEAQGCDNSTGRGALLGAFGTASVASDDFALCAEGLPPGPFTALLAGTAPAGRGIPFGDGLRCVDGTYFVLDSRPAGADGNVVYGPGLGAAGGWVPGDQRYFQVQYRDPVAGPCGSGFNLSQAVSILFEP